MTRLFLGKSSLTDTQRQSRPRVGIDLGGTKIEGILIDATGQEQQRLRLATPQGDYEGTLAAVKKLTDELCDNPDVPVGIGTPGSLSRVSPLMRNANSTCLNGKPLLEDFRSVLKRPVRIANDADCFTLSEASDGAAANGSLVFGVILGTGVGGGLCVNRQLISGINGISGEWGHNPLPLFSQPPALKPADSNQPPHANPGRGRTCFCGRQDCIETWLSGPGLARSYRESSGKEATAAEIANLAENGDVAAVETVSRYLDALAASLSLVINIVDPDTIVLGGGLSNMEIIYRELPERLVPHVFSDHVATKVVQAEHGDSSGVRGAAWLWP